MPGPRARSLDVLFTPLAFGFQNIPRYVDAIPEFKGLQGTYIIDVLALAGIRPEQCNAELVTA